MIGESTGRLYSWFRIGLAARTVGTDEQSQLGSSSSAAAADIEMDFGWVVFVQRIAIEPARYTTVTYPEKTRKESDWQALRSVSTNEEF
eukprot:scaffold2299_cov131-Cylindrotheca_fusiformis.AAC.42